MSSTAMPAKNWHRFHENEVGDDVCGRCDVQVTFLAHVTFSLPCPAPRCLSPKNPDDGCLFTEQRSASSACLYCGAKGIPPRGEDEVEDQLGDLLATEADEAPEERA